VRIFPRATPRNALLAFALLAVVAELSLRPMAESDLFFRIKAGQEILAQHRLPGRNLFSFTYPDYPDIDAAWLFEVGAAGLYAWGGFPAIVVAKTAALLAAFGLAFWLCRRRGAGPVATALALAGAALVGRDRFVERPHIFSLLGVVGLLLAIDVLARAGTRVGRAAALVCAGVALWANLHAGAFVAPLLLACAAAGALLDRDRTGSARRLGLVALGAGAAVFATPIGFGLIRYLRLHLTLPALHPVDEFRAPTWLSDPAAFVYGAAFLFMFGALAYRSRARRFGWTQALPALALALLAARSVRFTADFALASAPLLAVGLTAVGEAARARWPKLVWDRAAFVGVTALLIGMAAGPSVAGAGSGIGLDTRELPLSALAFIDANGLRDRMYNDFEIGSYLLFEPAGGYPHHRVFVDPRLPAYPPELHRLLGRADLTRAEWSAAMDRYGVETALLAYAGINARVAWWDPERYALVFREADARVFVRRIPRFTQLIARYEIPATFAFTPQDGTTTLPLDTRPAASPVPDCEWQRRLGDLTFDLDGTASTRTLAAYDRALSAPAGCLQPSDDARLASWMGALALEAGRAADALPLLDRAVAHGDRELATLTNRAVALEAMGRTSPAVAAWEAVMARAGATPLGARARTRRDRLLGR
jgi:hypothetical protein